MFMEDETATTVYVTIISNPNTVPLTFPAEKRHLTMVLSTTFAFFELIR